MVLENPHHVGKYGKNTKLGVNPSLFVSVSYPDCFKSLAALYFVVLTKPYLTTGNSNLQLYWQAGIGNLNFAQSHFLFWARLDDYRLGSQVVENCSIITEKDNETKKSQKIGGNHRHKQGCSGRTLYVYHSFPHGEGFTK